MIELVPIKEFLHENEEFITNPDCRDSLGMCIDFYQRVGFKPPWICYYVQMDGQLVAAAAFKGKPVDNKVEIAYGTFAPYQNKGIGTMIADKLVKVALQTDPSVRVTAQTLMQENYSTKILRKNNFVIIGKAMDEDEGEVWEWEYQRLSESPHKSESPKDESK